MSYCQACQAEIDADSRFCKFCGFATAPIALSPLDPDYSSADATGESPSIPSPLLPTEAATDPSLPPVLANGGPTDLSLPAVGDPAQLEGSAEGYAARDGETEDAPTLQALPAVPSPSSQNRTRTFTGPPQPPPVPVRKPKMTGPPGKPAPPASDRIPAPLTPDSATSVEMARPEADTVRTERTEVDDDAPTGLQAVIRLQSVASPSAKTADSLRKLSTAESIPVNEMLATEPLAITSRSPPPVPPTPSNRASTTANSLRAACEVGPAVSPSRPPAEEREPPDPPQPPSARQHAGPPPHREDEPPRRSQRFVLKAEVNFTSEHNFFTGFLENISDGGLFLASHDLLPIGETVDLTLTIPGIEEAVEVSCEVRWVREDSPDLVETVPGMGLAFKNLSKQASRAIDAFIRHRDPIFFAD
jgi:uncharacterized protein (TIGR02266 family)